MRVQNKFIRCWLCVFTLVFFAQQVQADSNSPIISILDGSRNQIKKDSSVTSKDSLFFSSSFAPNLVKPYPIQDVITFHINEQSHVVLPSSFTAVVHLRITYTDANSHVDSLNDLRLSINYRADSAYTARANFIFNGAYMVTIKVLSDTISSSVISALMIDNEIIPEYVYTWTCTEKDITNINSTVPSPDKIDLSWKNIVGADGYDLEWTYIDSSALASGLYTVNGSIDPSLVFSNNSTRVTTSDLDYRIPLIFPGAGSLFARVRTVHYDKGQRIVSNWSSNYTNGFFRYDFGGHEPSLNWQSSISFTEDGNRKIVVQYFDGSLRSRQTAAKDQALNQVLAAETFYDYQGRPAIQVLPAPTINNIVEYTSNFNRINGAEYDKTYFDSVISPNTSCSLTAPAMDSNYGAAMYYSANNLLINQNQHSFIPKAYGYAFTQTEYTQDNTGRISRQGGVGEEFQLNSGHETRYYYSLTPDQNELDALFGTEAGDHTHYFKNAVRDANGQYSISYVDMHGRTIATALSGSAPGGLSALGSNNKSVITQTLADASTNTTQGLSMISHKSILIDKSGPQHFIYSLNPQSLQLADCNSQNICYDCLYDLNITITDDCNNQKLGGHPLVINRPNISIADTLCNATGIAVDTTIYLDEGEYQITKTLTVNTAAEQDYFNNVYTPHNTCKSQSDFISFQEQALPHGDCAPTCESCRAAIGTYADFEVDYMTKVYGDTSTMSSHQKEIQAAYNNALATCDAYCDDVVDSTTDFLRQAMLFDMSPKSGQYANLDSSGDIYSIFYSSTPEYQNVHDYKDAEGNLDSVWDNIENKKVPPDQLDAKQFAENFKPSWANSLLIYHPEYCKYQEYQNHYNAYTWDKKFGKVTSYADAVTNGYDSPTTGTDRDPLMNDVSSYDFDGKLSNKYAHYDTSTKNGVTRVLSMWDVAKLQTKCPSGDTDCIQNIVFTTQDYTLSCKGDSDQAWRSFQSLYSAYRNELLNDYYAGINCTVTSQQLTDDHHYLNFNTSASLLNTGGLEFASSGDQQEIKDSAQAQMYAYYKSSCEAYKTLWTQQLLPGYDTDKINQILPMLVDVCVAGADQSHPFGSRDISINTPSIGETINGGQHYVRSFDDIINTYNATYPLSPSITRNADVITQPPPYASPQVYNQPLITKPDQSQCDEINSYYSLYQSEGLSSETFSQYLKRTTNTDITEEDLDALQSSCAETGTECSYLSQPVALPPIFQDRAQSPCTDCYLFNSLVSQYTSRYGDSAYPQITSQDDTLQQRKNQLFTNFMNNQLGYNLTTGDYLEFLERCQGYAASTSYSQLYQSAEYVQPITEEHANCHFSISDRASAANAGILYRNKFNVQSAAYPYNIPADLVYKSSNNNSSWSNSQNSWSTVKGFTGNALQINTAGPDTTTLTLTYYLEDTSYRERLAFLNFYYFSSDSGYTNYDVSINGRYQAQGNLNTGTNANILHPSDALIFYNMDYQKGDAYEFIITVRLFGGMHGQSAIFKLDDFTLYGADIYNPSNTVFFDSLDESSNQIFFDGFFDTITPTHPFVDTDANRDHSITNAVWTNSYNNWASYFLSYFQFNPTLAITSATQDTAILTLTLNIADGYTLNVDRFGIYVYSSRDSGYQSWSMCMNGKFVGQDSTYPFSWDSQDSMWRYKTGFYYPVFNPIRNISNQLTITIKLFGGLHGKSSVFAFNTFQLDGSILHFDNSVPKLCGRSQPAYPIAKLDTITACTDSTFYAVSTGMEMYNNYVDSAKNNFDSLYYAKCLQAYNYETFTVTDTVSEYHYTLYYYDQAGNLVQTIPPKAVHPNWNSTYLAQVKTKRAAGDTLRPGHDLSLATQYRYNTLNQVITQKSPDAGSSNFYYDRLGRLVLSQNAKQSPVHKFSYTTYDSIGRINEVGELTNSSTMNTSISKTPAQLQSWLTGANSSRTQITQTTYDIPYFGIDSLVMNAKNLRNRVSYVQYFDNASNQTNATPQAGTYYSYDIEGNADTVIQDYTIPSISKRYFKKIVYRYDLISGNVNAVDYNPGEPDAFHHRYTYDGSNRLSNVETSIDSIYWENEATYRYYYHGPLARTFIGEQQVQGVDYAYTLQGWLKGVNTTNINTSFDMGLDGFSTRPDVGRDVYGFALHYFPGDYTAVKDLKKPFAPIDKTVLSDFKPLYNGNIAAMSENLSSFTKPLLFNYGYDQLNRLIQMRTYKNTSGSFSSSSNVWNPVSVPDYSEDISYDANGNILKYKRYGNSTNTNLTNAQIMDSLNYKYISSSNKLDWIKDSVPSSNYTVDIDNQADSNYKYDAIGNLVKDSTGGIDSISWNVYGKIQKINKHDGTVINYYYDAAGNRIGKAVTGTANGNGETWYVHDASGNIMGVYTVNDNTVNSGALTLSEQDIYGSSRLGLYKPNLNLVTYTPPTLTYMNSLGNVGYNSSFIRGKKFFELTNHLGNVLVTVTDKKIGIDGSDNDGVVNYFNADIVSAQSYYPGGMIEPGRTFTTSSSSRYRYSFNDKEDDAEAESGYQDYGMREYDRLSNRFISVDPLAAKYAKLSPYQFASNRPTIMVDLDGMEGSMGISGSALVYPQGHSMIEFDVDGDWKPDYNAGWAAGMLITLGGGYTVLTLGTTTSIEGWTLRSMFSNMLHSGILGSTVNTAISFASHQSGYEKTKAAVSGFFSGAILGLTQKGGGLTNILATGGLSGSVGELVNQTFDEKFGNGDGYNLKTMIVKGGIGAVANFLSTSIVDKITKAIDKNLAEDIAKTETEPYQQKLKKAIMERSPRAGPQQLKKLLNKETKAIQSLLIQQANANKAALTQAIERTTDYLQEKANNSLPNTDKKP